MDLLDWTSILIIFSSLISAHWVFRKLKGFQSVTIGLFSIALILLIIHSCISLLQSYINSNSVLLKWLELSIYLVLASSLFSFVRDLKPKFSKFPLYLVFLPLLTLLFFPLVMDNRVISDLIFVSYQGGAIIVALLLFSLIQYKTGGQILQIVGSLIFSLSFICFWVLDLNNYNEQALAKVFLSLGIVITGKGINNHDYE